MLPVIPVLERQTPGLSESSLAYLMNVRLMRDSGFKKNCRQQLTSTYMFSDLHIHRYIWVPNLHKHTHLHAHKAFSSNRQSILNPEVLEARTPRDKFGQIQFSPEHYPPPFLNATCSFGKTPTIAECPRPQKQNSCVHLDCGSEREWDVGV